MIMWWMLSAVAYVCLGIDVGRFIADEQYKLETILGLAMWVYWRDRYPDTQSYISEMDAYSGQI